jgi:3-oxoacyl-[acyl-carrier protein] reductase
MNYNLNDKVAVITGGSHGIGKEIALELASEGCHVAICSRDKYKLALAKHEIVQRGHKCLAVSCDVLDDEQIRNFIESVISFFGTVHILVNNVGGGGRWGKPDPCETEYSVWTDVYNKNVGAAIKFTLGFLPYMRSQKWGRIIAITSKYGIEIGGRPWFNIAKVAEGTFIKNMSMQKNIIRDGITFNTVAPGDIMIPDTGWDDERKNNPNFNDILDNYIMGRMGLPEDVAAAVTFLCSDKASYINGSTITVDGGQSNRL